MQIAIIGGGAAGFFGAITAAAQNPSAKIVIFEATQQPLEKVLISGGERCNVTHHCFDPAELVKGYPRGHKELLGPFTRFQPRNTVEWFESRGVKLKAEDDGRMFPITDDSRTIADCLINTARERGIEIRLGTRVKEIRQNLNEGGPSFEIECHSRPSELFDRVLLATGSAHQGYRFAEHLGHTIITGVPSLFTFKISDNRLDRLAGISFDNVQLTLKNNAGNRLEQCGPLLITHWGLSGPAVLKLSAWGARILHDCNYQAKLTINFLPWLSTEQMHQQLLNHRGQNPKKYISTETALPVPLRFWRRIIETVGVSDETIWSHLSKEETNAIIAQLTQGQYAIRGKGMFKEEFVTCGGVDLREVDFKTMQSKLCPGLFFAGEILDIDGVTGGFNFQNAWTTGWIAGMHLSES